MTQHQIDDEFRLMCASTLAELATTFAGYGDLTPERVRTVRRPPLTDLSDRLRAAGF